MTLILSQFLSEADAERLVAAFHATLTACVFAFLAMIVLLS